MTTAAFTDAELLAQARRGDETAFAELYVRHESAARRLANSYSRAGDPDDLVNGAFERVLQALRKGMGPTEAFRAYLFVTLRRLAADRAARSRDAPYDELPAPVRAEAHDELDPGERSLIVRAYESLSGRWQTVLWHTAVEGRPPRELAPALGMSANAAAALAYRAREKLRQAYLQAHLQTTPRPECEPHRSRLGAYVRDGLGSRDRSATADHIGECTSCRGLVAELADVNRLLVRALFPIFFSAGEVAAALAASSVTTTAVAGAAAGGTGGAAGGALRGATDIGRRTWSRARSNPGVTSAVIGTLLVVAVIAGALIAARDDRLARPASPPVDEAAPATPPVNDPEPPEVPLVVSPPASASPIASSSERPPTTSGPDPAPSTAPSTSPPSSTPTTSSPPTVPPPSSPPVPPAPPGTDPPPEIPPTSPPTTPPPQPPDEPCVLVIDLGALLDLRICLDAALLEGQSGGRGLKFSQ